MTTENMAQQTGIGPHVTQHQHVVFECRCSPYYRNTAFYPLIDGLRQKLAWQDDSIDDKLEKLEARLAQCDVPQTEAVQLLANLLSLSLSEARYPPLKLTPQE
jgi:hypothetical protein